MLRVDRLTQARAGIVALTVAQSAAMEYYEQIVDQLFSRTGKLVERLELRGTVALSVRPLHRFIGEAISTRSEVLAVLHLLDKPDAAWDDSAMDRIYDDLRDEFDLVDRYAALASKLQSIQESLVLVLDVARDRRLVLLEVTVVLLILLEVILSVGHFT
jgi:required for meiotic nuclear division protein 1